MTLVREHLHEEEVSAVLTLSASSDGKTYHQGRHRPAGIGILQASACAQEPW